MGLYILSLVLFCIGLYSVLANKNIIKIIIGIVIMEYAVSLLFVLVGYRVLGGVPLLDNAADISGFVDPLPQAAVLLLMFMNLSVTVVAAAIAVRIYEKYGTFDLNEVRRLRG